MKNTLESIEQNYKYQFKSLSISHSKHFEALNKLLYYEQYLNKHIKKTETMLFVARQQSVSAEFKIEFSLTKK